MTKTTNEAKAIELLKDIEMLMRVNCPMTDGSTMHKSVKALLKRGSKLKG